MILLPISLFQVPNSHPASPTPYLSGLDGSSPFQSNTSTFDVTFEKQSIKFHTVYPSTPIQLQTTSTAEFLNASIAVSLSHLQTTAGRYTVENNLSILSYRQIDTKLFATQLKSLPQCGDIASTLQPERWTVFNTLFVLLFYGLVDFEVVDTFCCKQ